MTMSFHRLFASKFSRLYPMYVQKAERKNRTQAEVDQVICWLTGYDLAALQRQIEHEVDVQSFFAQAPAFHPNSTLIRLHVISAATCTPSAWCCIRWLPAAGCLLRPNRLVSALGRRWSVSGARCDGFMKQRQYLKSTRLSFRLSSTA